MSSAAIFITLEGPDGAGKSTQARLLAERFRSEGREVLVTREPGGTALGEQIRELLLNSPAGSHESLSDALLFNAARSKLVSEVIRPALERGEIVICDRFSDSTLAYQGYGGGLAIDELRTLASIATGGLSPSRTVLIDLPVASGLGRRTSGDVSGLTRFETDEAHGSSFHERVREGFLELARREPERWRIVDGSRSEEEVGSAVWSAVAGLFGDEKAERSGP